jgi:hypothetical protein
MTMKNKYLPLPGIDAVKLVASHIIATAILVGGILPHVTNVHMCEFDL